MKKRPGEVPKPESDEPPAPEGEVPMDRFLQFGRALFAVPKDEIPKRDRAEKPKRPDKKRNTAPGG